MAALLKNTVIYVLVGFLPVAANFLLAPIYTKYLLPSEYALVGIATLFQAFLTYFISLSMDGSFSRLFFNYHTSDKLKHGLLSSLLLAVSGLSVLVFLALWMWGNELFSIIFANPGFRFSNFGYWVCLTTTANVIFLFFAILYRNEERVGKFVVINLAFFFLPVAGALVGLIFFGQGALGSVAGRAIGSLTVVLALMIGYFSRRRLVLKLKFLRKAIRYSLPLIPYQLMFAAFLNLDRIILEHRFQPHDFGVYNFAVMVSGLIPIFINAVANAVNPRIFKELTSQTDPANVHTLNRFTLLGTTFVICLSMACVVPAMRLIISTEYSDAYVYIATLLLAYLPYAHYLIYSLPFFYSGKTKPFPVISAFALIAGILFNMVFIDTLGLWAVCLSLYVIRITQAAVAYIFIRSYRFHHLAYLQQGPQLLTSLCIILIYNGLLFVNLRYEAVPVDVINLVPMAILLVLIVTIYSSEVQILTKSARSFIYGLLPKSASDKPLT